MFILIASTAFLAVGCTNSNPAIELLQKTMSPTKGGVSEWTETTRNLLLPVNIAGECDRRATGIEFSLNNGTTWQNANTLSPSDTNCGDATFSFTLPQSMLNFEEKTSDRRSLHIRQIMGGSSTTSAIVTIKYVSPLGPRQGQLRVVLGKLRPAGGLPFDVQMRAYARGAAR